MINVVLVVILLAIAGSAIGYLYGAKKRGEHCVGCPYAKQCSSKSCSCESEENSSLKQ